GAGQFFDAHAREHGQCDACPHARNLDQRAKGAAFRVGGKAVQHVTVVAHLQMGMQNDLGADIGQLVQRAHGYDDFVADAPDVDVDGGGRLVDQDAADASDHDP